MIIKYLILILTYVNSFQYSNFYKKMNYNMVNSFESSNFYKRNILKKSTINMNYNIINYDNKLNILSSYQTSIIINNWIQYLSLKQENIEEFIFKTIYDFRVFISINKEDKNTLYMAWCPNIESDKHQIIYLIACKLIDNNLEVYRIAQNPYYNNIIDIDSKELIKDMEDIKKIPFIYYIFNLSFNELHKYDNRFLLSWNFNL